MRYLLSFLILLSGMIACKQTVKGKNGVTYKSAVDYNDYIVNRQTTLMKKVLEFSKIADISLDSAEKMLNQSVLDAGIMINEIKGMPPYKGDSALRNAAVNSFSFYRDIFKNEYMSILQIRKKGEENITEEDVTEVNRIIEDITKKEESLDKTFHNAQKEYAEKNKMKLINNKAQQDIEKEFDKIGNE